MNPHPPHRRTPLRFLHRHPGAVVVALLLGFAACSGPVPAPSNAPQALVDAETDHAVLAGTDDAEEYPSGSVTRSSTRLELVDASSNPNQTVGLRFAGVLLPPGARVTAAHIQFTAAAADSGPTTLTVRGQAADDAATFTSMSGNVTGRPRTQASATWTPAAWQKDSSQRTPDLSAIVQEVIARPGWQSGNALAFIIMGSGKRVAWAFDGNASAAATLHVAYQFEDSPPAIGSFSVSPATGSLGEMFTFHWSVSDPEGQVVHCQLDADGDGVSDVSIPDCAASTSQPYSYAQPGTYAARLSTVDSDGAGVSATTQVRVVSANSVVVAAAGDISCDPASTKFNGGEGLEKYCKMKVTSELILAMNPDAVLALGDIQYEQATMSQFMGSYDLFWGRFKSITYPVVGNHEYLTPNAADYFAYFGAAAGDPAKGYYSFDLGEWHIVALNSSCSGAGGCKAGSPQERWLRADLAAHPRACTLAFWHIPRYSSGALGSKATYADLWQALYDHGADLVLVGHDHNYERFAPQDAYGNADPRGMRQFVVGTGGKNHTSIYSVQPNSEVRHSGTFGVLQLTLKPTGYDWAFVPEPGQTFADTGSAACH